MPPVEAPLTPSRPTAQRQRHGRSLLPARRWRLAGLLASILVIAVASVLVHAWSGPAGPAKRAGGGTSGGLAAEQAARTRAVVWVAQQVSRGTVVACDRVMCSSLEAQGFPVGNLLVLGPTATDPLGASLVIATADIRSQIGSRLGPRYAPQVIASFDFGSARIDIRAVFPGGAAAYRTALSADLQIRKQSGAELLHNSRIATSATASRQLVAGQVDSRLLIAIAVMASEHPVRLVDFSGLAPGASASSPLRFADVAEPGGAGRTASLAYLRSVRALLGAQNPPYRPLRIVTARLAGGQSVLRIEFAAPSPLGLLAAASR